MNIILTSTTGGLTAADIEPFFYSLRHCGYQDEVAVFASRISNESRAVLEKYQAKVIDFEYKGMPIINGKKRLWHAFKRVVRYYATHRRGEKDFDHLLVNNSRFFHYLDYLSGLKQKPEKVLMADIRDIVFQRDPFSFPFQPGLYVAKECRTVGQSRGGIKQLLVTVGLGETLKLSRENIINGGTIVGDYDLVVKYLEMFTTHFSRFFFWALFEGIDQALHTYFVHTNRVSPVHCHQNWDGPFLTLDSVIVRPENKNSEGYLCNEDGSIIPIVHQYDRVDGLYRIGEPKPSCWQLYQSKA